MGKDKMNAGEIDLSSGESGLDGESNQFPSLGREDSDTENDDAQSAKRTRYRLHTPHQIHGMEVIKTREITEFMSSSECSHASVKKKEELDLKLRLGPSHVKSQFQDTLNQMKMRHEHRESIQLQTTNERLRAENKRFREALCTPACAACGRSLCVEELSCEEHQLRMENAKLRAKIGLVTRLGEAYTGKRLPPSF